MNFKEEEKGQKEEVVGLRSDMIRLADVVTPRVEKALPKDFPDLPFIGLDDIEAHTMRLLGTKPAAKLKSSAKRFYPGDVLYSRLRPYLNKVWYADRPGICSSEFIVLPGNDLIDPKFLTLRLNASDFVSFANSLNAGDRPRVDFKQISSFFLPPFSLKQQRRIVAKIEALFSELDKGVESLKTAREQLKICRQAVLKHAFEGKLTAHWREENADKLESPEQLLTRIQQEREVRYQQQLQEWKEAVKAWEKNGKEGRKPGKPKEYNAITKESINSGSLPAEWAAICVADLNSDVFDGPFGSNLKSSDYVEHGVRVIRLENIGHLRFIENKRSYITKEKYASLEKHTVHYGDIIFSSFVTEGIRVAILPKSIEKAINKADCFCIRLHGEAIRNDYLASYLSTRSAYKQIEAEIHGVGRPRVNTSQLKGFSVPLCSREEQDEIMQQLKRSLSVADQLEMTIVQELSRCETIRQVILKKGFSGQLILKDFYDEPSNPLSAPTGRSEYAKVS